MKTTLFAIVASLLMVFSAAAETAWAPSTSYDSDVVIGSPKAPVTVVEYASLTCPHCGRFHNESLKAFKEGWIDTGKARLVFRHLPLDQSALAAALTVSCLPADKRPALLSALFSSVAEWAPKQDLAPVLEKTFGGEVKFGDVMACVATKGFPEKVMQAGTDAVNNGVDSTPTFFVNGKKLVGFQTADQLGKAVDEKLADEVLQ